MSSPLVALTVNSKTVHEHIRRPSQIGSRGVAPVTCAYVCVSCDTWHDSLSGTTWEIPSGLHCGQILFVGHGLAVNEELIPNI